MKANSQRRGLVALTLAAALSAGSAAPAIAAPKDQASTQSTESTESSSEAINGVLGSSESEGSEGSSAVELSSEAGSTEGSSQEAAEKWDSLNRVEKFFAGLFGASAFFFLLGMLRTAVYSVAGI